MNSRSLDITTDSKRVNVNKFISHLIVISMLFLLPEFIMGYAMSTSGKPGSNGIQWHMYAKSLIFIAAFYIEYYYIIGHTLTPKVRLWKFLCYNILMLVVALGISYLIWYFFSYLPRIAESAIRPIRHPEKFQLMFVSSIVRDGVMVILTIGLAVAIRLSGYWSALERQRRDIASEQKASELRNLKSQLNPHFLFNTLNSIYALIEISPAEAQTAVHELSQMLRYMLYETPSRVTLTQETDFSRNYISLMELRLQPGVVKTHIDIDDMGEAPIAPLLFISLIENAFKHGNTGDPADHITIDITAHDGVITCRTHNRFDSKTLVDRQGGIGIANLRRRLLLIYGSSASLTTTIDGDSYTAILTININPTDQ
ncbi:MAG: sensor histidine kinase [Muribaculaceae bacterium]|nr:sensor histidine kinase [Muribaculaceae bacterium]